MTVTNVDALVERLLRTHDTIAVVGASRDSGKAAHQIPGRMQQMGWRIIPVNPYVDALFGEKAYPTLADVPEPLGLVDVFRPSTDAPDVARQAVAAGATALWLQLGIVSQEAREIAAAAGIDYVENRCLAVERAKLDLHAPVR
jgi:predicted CoA-binding protein